MITYHFISARFNDYFDFDVSIANDIAKCALMQWSPCPEVHALTNGNGRYIMKLNDISFSIFTELLYTGKFRSSFILHP